MIDPCIPRSQMRRGHWCLWPRFTVPQALHRRWLAFLKAVLRRQPHLKLIHKTMLIPPRYSEWARCIILHAMAASTYVWSPLDFVLDTHCTRTYMVRSSNAWLVQILDIASCVIQHWTRRILVMNGKFFIPDTSCAKLHDLRTVFLSRLHCAGIIGTVDYNPANLVFVVATLDRDSFVHFWIV